ncbi:4'-phosphopantetheinyl transferase family protein [Amycolatopsis anabasis]|uniref:4'-phosphopantetheinyl transferase family protein n=1 Tax=Amycolatopsis anabasis TaxID=1840409 RepID=UPI00131C4751|nr:4'-phosphopantetheinyl transferase superfamily protein [Amycolatopsis anabasis]
MLERILPRCVHVAERRTDDTGERLYPEELAHISRAVPKRRNEFTTVRHCARLALRGLGLPRPPLVPGERGAPTWPDDVVGSMTHCAGYRAAVVADREEVRSLGIDAEPDAPLPSGVAESVTRVAEREHLAELSAATAGAGTGPHWDRLLFSAKESVYKTWFPLARRWLGFEDAEVRIRLDGTFVAELLVDGPVVDGRRLARLNGRWLAAEQLLLTAIVLPPNPS